jgi:hypothetical protein
VTSCLGEAKRSNLGDTRVFTKKPYLISSLSLALTGFRAVSLGNFVPVNLFLSETREWFNFRFHSVVTSPTQNFPPDIDYVPFSLLQVRSPAGSFTDLNTFLKHISS